MADETLKIDANNKSVVGFVTDDANQFIKMGRIDDTTKGLKVMIVGGVGGGTVTSLTSSTGILLTPNPITTTGTIGLSTALAPIATLAGNSLKVLRVNAGETAVEYATPGSGTVTSVSVVTANGVSGSVATATTTPAITLTLGAITPTTVNGNTFTTGTYTLTGQAGKTLTFNGSITLTGTDAQTYTFPTTSATLARTDAANTFTGASTASAWVLTSPTITTNIKPTSNDGAALGVTNTNEFSDLFLASGALISFANSNVVLTHSSGILTMGTGEMRITTIGTNTASVVTVGGSQSLTGKTYNGLTITTSSGTFTLTNAKTFAVTGSLTLSGTDSTTMTFPATSATIARTDAANTFTGTQTFSGIVAVNGTATSNINGPLDISAATAGQIVFPASQNASANANTLDDYEEGTFTPTIGGNATYTTQVGLYQKIGNRVFIDIHLTINSLGTGSVTNLSGLPFAASTSAASLAMGLNVSYWGSIATSVYYMSAFIRDGDTFCQFTATTGATASATAAVNVFQNGAEIIVNGSYRTA